MTRSPARQQPTHPPAHGHAVRALALPLLLAWTACGPGQVAPPPDVLQSTSMAADTPPGPPPAKKTVYIVDHLIGAVYPVEVLTPADELLDYRGVRECAPARDLPAWPADSQAPDAQRTCVGPFAYRPACVMRHEHCQTGSAEQIEDQGEPECLTAQSCAYLTGPAVPATHPGSELRLPVYNCDPRPESCGRPSEEPCRMCYDEATGRRHCEAHARQHRDDRLDARYGQASPAVQKAARANSTVTHTVRFASHSGGRFAYCENVVSKLAQVAYGPNEAQCGCVLRDHPLCWVPPSVCEKEAGQPKVEQYSEPGQSVATLRQQIHSAAVDQHEGYDGARCLSCEPISAEDDPAGRYACLIESEALLPGLEPAAAEVLAHEISRQKRLLFELQGDEIFAASGQGYLADAIGDLVDPADPAYRVTDCGTVVNTAPVPSECTADMGRVLGTIELCQRMRTAGRATVSYGIEECLGLLAELSDPSAAAAATACHGSLHRELMRRINFDLLDRQLETIRTHQTGLGALDRQVALINTWFITTQHAIDFGSGASHTSAELLRDLEYILDEFWRRAYDAGQVIDPAGEIVSSVEAELAKPAGREGENADKDALQQSIEHKLGQMSERGYDVDRRVLAAAYALALAEDVGGPFLVMLTSDALHALAQKLEDMAVFHDFACHFKENGCRATTAETNLSRFWRILASLEQEAELDQALSVQADTLQGWHPAFSAVKAAHHKLRRALGPHLGTAASDLVFLPEHVRPLLEIVRRGQERYANFSKMGLFDPRERSVISSGLTKEERDKVIEAVRYHTQALCSDGGAMQYRGSENLQSFRNLVHDLINELGQSALVRRLEQERELLLTDTRNQAEDKRLLMADTAQKQSLDLENASADHDAAMVAFDEMLAAFIALDWAVGDDDYIEVLDPEAGQSLLKVSGDQAAYLPSADQEIADLSVHTYDALPAGDIIQVQASGAYSPTCALRQLRVMHPPESSSTTGTINTNGALAGPEGFTVEWSGDEYKTDAIQVGAGMELRSTIGHRSETCTGPPSASRAVVGMGHRDCFYADTSFTMEINASMSDTWGRNRRSSASFSAGLRLRNTPFPDLPVGALVAVLDSPTEGIIDVQIVRRPVTHILVPQQASVHLVVNDLGLCTDADATNELELHLAHLRPVQGAGSQIVQAMADVIAWLQTKRIEYGKLGQIPPSLTTSLAADSRTLLDSRLTVQGGLEALPPPVVGLWESFVRQNLVALEAAVQIEAIERDLALKRIQLLALEDQLAKERAGEQLKALLTRWTLRNLDGAELRHSAGETLEVVRRYLYPILKLWYPDAFAAFVASAEVDALKDINLDSSLIALATESCDVLNKLLDEYATDGFAPSRLPPPERPVLVVSFPRPDGQASMYHPEDGLSTFRKANAAESRELWAAIDGRGVGRVTITPEQLYSLLGGYNVLSCYESLPVVEQLVLYLANESLESDPYNGDLWLRSWASRDQQFTTAQGLARYQVQSDEHRNLELDVLAGPAQDAVARFRAWPADQRPVGLSPFASFHIDFSELVDKDDALSEARELLVVMSIQSQRASSPLPSPDLCQAPAGPPPDPS